MPPTEDQNCFYGLFFRYFNLLPHVCCLEHQDVFWLIIFVFSSCCQLYNILTSPTARSWWLGYKLWNYMPCPCPERVFMLLRHIIILPYSKSVTFTTAATPTNALTVVVSTCVLYVHQLCGLVYIEDPCGSISSRSGSSSSSSHSYHRRCIQVVLYSTKTAVFGLCLEWLGYKQRLWWQLLLLLSTR